MPALAELDATVVRGLNGIQYSYYGTTIRWMPVAKSSLIYWSIATIAKHKAAYGLCELVIEDLTNAARVIIDRQVAGTSGKRSVEREIA